MKSGTITVKTSSQLELVDITSVLQQELAGSSVQQGILFIYNPHTTAAITINEGADPAVRHDIVAALRRIVPFELAYKHMEGNSPAHVMSSLVGASETVFVEAGHMKLGTWQKIFFCEFDGPRTRKVHWRIME